MNVESLLTVTSSVNGLSLHCSPTWADDLDRERCVSLRESHFLFVVLDRDDAFDYGGGRIPRTQVRGTTHKVVFGLAAHQSIPPKSQIRPEREES
jgi:hypothetical protein